MPSVLSLVRFPRDNDWEDDEEDDDEDYEEEDLEDESEALPLSDPYPGIPKWRQPLKKLDFSNVRSDDRCPCGSGRKYKNCHGARSRKN